MSRAMTSETITHTGRVWRWNAPERGSWLFLTIDASAGLALSDTAVMRRLELGRSRGFGSLKVTARIGDTEWRTSVFPQRGDGTWLLPLKAAVRKAEGLDEGDEATVLLTPQ